MVDQYSADMDKTDFKLGDYTIFYFSFIDSKDVSIGKITGILSDFGKVAKDFRVNDKAR